MICLLRRIPSLSLVLQASKKLHGFSLTTRLVHSNANRYRGISRLNLPVIPFPPYLPPEHGVAVENVTGHYRQDNDRAPQNK